MCLWHQVRSASFELVHRVSGGGAPSLLAFATLDSVPLASGGESRGLPLWLFFVGCIGVRGDQGNHVNISSCPKAKVLGHG
jgi:hypothetical protein